MSAIGQHLKVAKKRPPSSQTEKQKSKSKKKKPNEPKKKDTQKKSTTKKKETNKNKNSNPSTPAKVDISKKDTKDNKNKTTTTNKVDIEVIVAETGIDESEIDAMMNEPPMSPSKDGLKLSTSVIDIDSDEDLRETFDTQKSKPDGDKTNNQKAEEDDDNGQLPQDNGESEEAEETSDNAMTGNNYNGDDQQDEDKKNDNNDEHQNKQEGDNNEDNSQDKEEKGQEDQIGEQNDDNNTDDEERKPPEQNDDNEDDEEVEQEEEEEEGEEEEEEEEEEQNTSTKKDDNEEIDNINRQGENDKTKQKHKDKNKEMDKQRDDEETTNKKKTDKNTEKEQGDSRKDEKEEQNNDQPTETSDNDNKSDSQDETTKEKAKQNKKSNQQQQQEEESESDEDSSSTDSSSSSSAGTDDSKLGGKTIGKAKDDNDGLTIKENFEVIQKRQKRGTSASGVQIKKQYIISNVNIEGLQKDEVEKDKELQLFLEHDYTKDNADDILKLIDLTEEEQTMAGDVNKEDPQNKKSPVAVLYAVLMVKYDFLKKYKEIKTLLISPFTKHQPFPLTFGNKADSFQELSLMAAIIDESTQDKKLLFDLLLIIDKVKKFVDQKIDLISEVNKRVPLTNDGQIKAVNKLLHNAFEDDQDKLYSNVVWAIKRTYDQIHQFLFTKIDNETNTYTFVEFDKKYKDDKTFKGYKQRLKEITQKKTSIYNKDIIPLFQNCYKQNETYKEDAKKNHIVTKHYNDLLKNEYNAFQMEKNLQEIPPSKKHGNWNDARWTSCYKDTPLTINCSTWSMNLRTKKKRKILFTTSTTTYSHL